MPLLPVTPHPFAEESVFSWLMRVAERNFARSIWDILSLAGLNQSEMKSSRIDTSRLWHLISEDEKVLDGIGYRHGEGMAFRGHSIPSRDLTVMTPKLCPQCIDEKGYASAHWDLALVTACHVHRRRLINKCPSCGAKITWFRSSMHACPCGANFRDAAIEEPSADEVDLNRLIYEVAFNKSSSCAQASPAYQSLHQVPLRYLFRFITAIGMLNSVGRIVLGERMRAPVLTLIPAAAEILGGWPSTCHDFLMRLASRTSHVGQERFGVLGHIDDLCRSTLSSHDDRRHGLFLRQEINRFLAQTWDGSIEGRLLDSLLADGLTPRWLPLGKAAKILKTDTRTLTEIMRRGLIEHKTELKRKTYRILLRTEDVKPEWFTPTERLSARKGAALVGIPVSVLKELRAAGDYVQTYFGPLSIGYALRDLVALKEKILAGMPFTPTDTLKTVSFATLMKNEKLRSQSGKALIVRAIMLGQIRIANAESGNVTALHLHPDDLAQVRKDLDAPPAGQVTISQAAHELRSNPQAVKCLITRGYLESRQADEVDLASIMRFLDDHINLCKLLHYSKKKVAQAEELFAKEGLSLIVVPGRLEGASQYYVQRVHVPLIQKHLIKRTTRAKAGLTGEENCEAQSLSVGKRRFENLAAKVERLRNYLTDLRERGELLPRIAGKPKLSTIARECGFYRNYFYDNESLAKLLIDYDQDERARGRAKPDNITALRSYLTQLQTLDLDLPRRRTKPNLFAIARACGFQRNVFYSDSRLIDLLAAHARPDRCS